MSVTYRGKKFEEVTAEYYETLSPVDKMIFNMEYAKRNNIATAPLGGIGISDDLFEKEENSKNGD